MADDSGHPWTGAELLAKGLLLAGVVHPFLHVLTPEASFDPWLLWLAVGVTMTGPQLLVTFAPRLKPHLTALCAVPLVALTTHFFFLSAVNDMQTFYAVASVVMAVNGAMCFQRPRALLFFTLFVCLLAATSAALRPQELHLTYYGPLCVVLFLALWHTSLRHRAEQQIQRYQESLEDLVEERTRELRQRSEDLAQSNERLEQEIVERERTEASLRVWQRLQSVARLAGGVAHDFNNLLTTITVYAEMLRDALPTDSEERADAEQVCRAAQRATELTGQLLTFSRDLSPSVAPVDLNEVVREARSIVESVMGADIEVIMDLAPGAVIMQGNRSQFEQVLANLAANARDAMPEGGTLTLETRLLSRGEVPSGELPDDWSASRVAVLRARDTGTGMDDETLQHIFDPFYTTKEVGKGTGLGLAAVYGIVQQSRGWIRVESRPGEGSCFTVYWPSDEVGAVEEGGEGTQARTEARDRTSPRILVVDDEPALLSLLHRILQEEGFDVVSAQDAESALQALRDSDDPIDMMVTDVVLPRHSGIDLWHEAEQLQPDLRVLFISGHLHHPSLVSRELPSGTALLPKPFSADTLIDEVRATLAGRDVPTDYEDRWQRKGGSSKRTR